MWAAATPSARQASTTRVGGSAPWATYGRYHYDGALAVDGVYLPTPFEGQNGFAAALVGYQLRPRGLILKLYAGIDAEDQHIVPHDPNNSVQGSALGLRLQAESWLDLSERMFVSADAT